MDLRLDEVAHMLNVTEKTVARWLKEGTLPAYELDGQHLCNRDELESWMMRNIDLLGEHGEGAGGIHRFALFRAMHKGGVYSGVKGGDKEAVIQAACELVAPGLGLDAEFLSGRLMARERLAATGVGNGIGVPHARDFLLQTHYDAIVTVFPETPIEYGALDGQPVDVLFFLLACDDKRHLNLLAKIAHLSSDSEALEFLKRHPNKSHLLDFVKRWEVKL